MNIRTIVLSCNIQWVAGRKQRYFLAININKFDFVIYTNSQQCQFRMKLYFVAVNELEDITSK